LLLAPDGEGSAPIYKARQEAAKKIGLLCSSYWTKTNQPCLSVMLTYGSQESLDKTLAAIKIVAPHMIPIDGLLWFQIFEHTLSAAGSYYLKVKPDLSRAEIYRGSYQRIGEWPLEHALRYIQKNHWYDGKRSYDDTF